MNAQKGMLALAVGMFTAGFLLAWKYSRKPTVPESKVAESELSPEASFRRIWAEVLRDEARVFNGLFAGLQRIVDGSARSPEKILREWCVRTHYRWENSRADILCRENILPLTESSDGEALRKWAALLLDAAADAGIGKETVQILVLSEETAGDYLEWDGEELYPEDTVEIITPAWYQKGKLLEQGQCRKKHLQ